MRSTPPFLLDSPDSPQKSIMDVAKEIDHILPDESGEDSLHHHRDRWEKALGCVPPDELPGVLTRLKGCHTGLRGRQQSIAGSGSIALRASGTGHQGACGARTGRQRRS